MTDVKPFASAMADDAAKLSSVPSFVPVSNETAQIKSELEQPAAISPVIQIINAIQQLDEQQRKQLVSSYFAKDIQQLVDEQTRKATDSGYEAGLKQAQNEQEKILSELKVEASKQAQKIEQLLTTFSQLTPKVAIDTEANLIELVVDSVFKLIGQQLTTSEHIAELINNLATEYSDEKELVIMLSKVDFEVFEQLTEQVNLPEGVKVMASNELKAGDHKLKLATGSVESILQNKLHAFIEVINQTYAMANQQEQEHSSGA